MLFENQLLCGDIKQLITELPDDIIDCTVTSPPYYNLRNYHAGKEEIGMEENLQGYVKTLAEIFYLLLAKTKETGTLFLNLGNSYDTKGNDMLVETEVARELKQQGWILRNRLIWIKLICAPESTRRRFRCCTEYIFFFAKNMDKYYFDLESVAKPYMASTVKRLQYKLWSGNKKTKHTIYGSGNNTEWTTSEVYGRIGENMTLNKEALIKFGSNPGDCWLIPYKNHCEDIGTHTAVFPEELPYLCILAGCPSNGLVFDPFMGSGTTCAVAKRLGRKWLGIDLDEECIAHATARLDNIDTILCDDEEVHIVTTPDGVIKEVQPLLF